MKHLWKPLCLLISAWGCYASLARESEGARTNSILLNGPWEFAPGNGNEGAEAVTAQRQVFWRGTTLPGPFMWWSMGAANQTKLVWARRSFRVTAAQAQSLAVLRWNRIACGAAAFINGQKVVTSQAIKSAVFQALKQSAGL